MVLPLLLHGGILHLLMNGMAELRLALFIERRIGLAYTAALYIIGTIGGTVLSGCLSPKTAVSVGASSALMAMLGAYTADVLLNWSRTPPMARRAQLAQCIVWIVLVMLISLLPFVDAGAHLGGLVTGFLVGTLLLLPKSPLEPKMRQNVLIGASSTLFVYTLTTFLVLFLAVEPGPILTDEQLALACE